MPGPPPITSALVVEVRGCKVYDVVVAGGEVACGSCCCYGGKVSGGEIARSSADLAGGGRKRKSKGTARELERK